MIDQAVSWVSSLILNVISTWGYFGIFILMALESANIPIPSEIILPFAGFLVSTGRFEFMGVVLAGTLGNLVGSLLNYGLAYRYGDKAAILLQKLRLINKDELERATAWFRRRGSTVALLGRLLPVIRTFISFPAGMFQINLKRFAVLTFIGSFFWSAVLTYIGYTAGSNWNILEPYFRQFDYLIVLAAAAALIFELKRRIGSKKPGVNSD